MFTIQTQCFHSNIVFNILKNNVIRDRKLKLCMDINIKTLKTKSLRCYVTITLNVLSKIQNTFKISFIALRLNKSYSNKTHI